MNARQHVRRRLTAQNASQMTGPGHDPGPRPGVDDVPLVDEEELEAIRWAGYDTAMTDATEHKDRAIAAAADRLTKTMQGAYADYARAVDAAEKTFAAARRAAMNAHELAHAGGQS